MDTRRPCCCDDDDDDSDACKYFTLFSCGSEQPMSSPRYFYSRCDVYELETGNPAEECPDDWIPNRYIVWNQDPSPCSSDPKCGFFVCADSSLLAPTQITTAAVEQGLQTDPPLTVTNDCPAVSNGPGTLASRSELLAWLDIDDCCSDECGNHPGGAAIGCYLRTSYPCTVAFQDILSRTKFQWLPPSGNASGTNDVFPGGWFGALSIGELPTTWTITNDPGGANGLYSAEWEVPVTVLYSVTVGCDPFNYPDCGSSPTTQLLSFSDTIRLQVGVNTFGFGCTNKRLMATVGVVSNSSIPNQTCGQSGNWYGGVESPFGLGIGCTSEIRFSSANYFAFPVRVSQPSLAGYAPICLDEYFNTVDSPIGYIEITTPLGPPEEYC